MERGLKRTSVDARASCDYKEQVIELLKRVCTVSVETMEVVKGMEKAER